MTRRHEPRYIRARSGRHHRRALGVEGLEVRTLLSYGGGLDFTFGKSGVTPLATTVSFEAGYFNPTASTVDAGGKLVVVGEGLVIGPGMPEDYTATFFADRYNADGSRDSTFNDKALFSVTSLQGSGSAGFGQGITNYGEATAVAIQPDGKIVIAGDVASGPNNLFTAKVVRLNTDGMLDTTFGTAGIVTLGSPASGDSLLDYATSAAILPGGLIAIGGAKSVAGTTVGANNDTPAVEVLNANGSIDTAYGTNGLAVAPLPSGVQGYSPIVPVHQSNFSSYTSSSPVEMVAKAGGQVLIVANAVPTPDPTIAAYIATQFNASGIPDPSFGVSGQVVVTPGQILTGATSATASAVALQADGKLVVGGYSQVPGISTRVTTVRLDTDGTFDPTYGIGGVSIFGNVIPGDTSDSSTPGAMAIQPDGKIVLVDRYHADYQRLNANGTPDLSFGTGGSATYYTNTPYYTLSMGSVGLAIQSSGKILTVGGNLLVRLLGFGSSGDYDEDGTSDVALYLTQSGTFGYAASSGAAKSELFQFGTPGAGNTLPAPGAYDGGGVDELAIYLPAQGAFAIRGYGPYSSRTVPFGTPGLGNTLPAPGDYDGSGKTELGAYLANYGVFAYRPANGGSDQYITIGTAGAGRTIPAPGDYFGTGQDDVAVYVKASASYVIHNPTTGQNVTVPFGTPGLPAVPVPGDYDGSGHDELAVYLPTYGLLIYRPANGGPDVALPFGTPGTGNALPAPGDYDGSGKTEVAAYLPIYGNFAYRPANGGPDVSFPIGVAGQTIPFVLNAASISGGSGSGNAFAVHADEIPLTPDLLENLGGPTVRKTTQRS